MEVQGKYLKDEEGNVFSPVTNIKTIFNDTGINLLDLFYPVGTIYQTLSYNFDPNESWGGDWVRLLDGATLVDSGYNVETDSTIIGSSVGQIVGNKFHTLTSSELPKITGNFVFSSNIGLNILNGTYIESASGVFSRTKTTGSVVESQTTKIEARNIYDKINFNIGNNTKFELTPKSLVVCMWKRIA